MYEYNFVLEFWFGNVFNVSFFFNGFNLCSLCISVGMYVVEFLLDGYSWGVEFSVYMYVFFDESRWNCSVGLYRGLGCYIGG